MRLRVLSQTVAALCLLSPLIVWSETLVTLDVGFGVRYVPPSRISVPAGERVTVVAPRDAGEQWIRDGRPLEGKTPNVLV